MSRWQTGVLLALAAIVGVATGVVMFVQAGPIPLLPAATDDSTPRSTGTAPSATASPSSTRPTSSPDPSEPAFTELALLQPEDFDEHNWKDTETNTTWDWLPDQQITSCAHMSPTDGQPVEAYSATYEGRVTVAAEIVVRYANESAAREALQSLSDRIDSCASAPQDEPALQTEPMSSSQAEDAVRVALWETTGTDSDAKGVVGIARAGDRLAFLSLLSPKPGSAEILDPRDSTYVDALYVYAGRRLV